ncbi:MAG TPA: hypothetical protein VNC50_18285, partial [Planctomycetia bacterium]|nr:hypothetical protein [Planctomycetia bacterium]
PGAPPTGNPWLDARFISSVEPGVCRALTARGKGEEALRRALRLHRIGDRIQNHAPGLLYLYCGSGMKLVALTEMNVVLRHASVSADLRDQVEKQLTRDEGVAVLSARLMAAESGVFEAEMRKGGFFASWPASALLKRDVARSLAAYQAAIELNSAPFSASLRLETELRDAARSPLSFIYRSQFAPPPVVQNRMASARLTAMARAVRILNALQRQGDESLPFDRLALPPETFVDPFDGAPLRRKLSLAGISIYSVGRDLKDDDGKVDPPQDFGIGPVPKPPDLKVAPAPEKRSQP